MGSPPPSLPIVQLYPTHASVGVGSSQSSEYTATIDGGIQATLSFYYDGSLVQQTYGNSATYSTPVADSAAAGNHTIRVVASNAGGTSEAFSYWHVVPCSPSGAYVDFSIDQIKCCPNNNWTSAMCHHNAILRVVWGNLGSGLAGKLSQCQWRSRDFCASQSFTPPQEYNKKIYLVSIVGKDANGNLLQHDVVAENEDDLENFEDYRFFQYTNSDIQINEKDNYDELIQMPKGYKDPVTHQVTKTEVSIRELNDVYVDCDTNSIKYRPVDYTEIASFLIDENGDVE
ncbi:hypothetical protein [Methanoregula formicica]|uniref:Ig-like domain-containing protein n=1 Tax=Methanoregula formicica (strain DSM 22288 / NBRC 105244 / SMSP) TaxID=593750 RepID=L0HDT0_METFS|nr:hypothetical protein [Methanoregula formicica]AGB01951.1 hypothetical protein Metfor_0896 [Methanoregula formicica SMSP]